MTVVLFVETYKSFVTDFSGIKSWVIPCLVFYPRDQPPSAELQSWWCSFETFIYACLCSYDFSYSKKKKRWIKIFKHTGYKLKIVFSLHRMKRRVKREDRKILSCLGKEIFNDKNERDFSLMLDIRKMGCWWKQLQLVPFSRQNYIFKDHFHLAVVQFELYELTCNWTLLSMEKLTSIEHDIFKKVTVI